MNTGKAFGVIQASKLDILLLAANENLLFQFESSVDIGKYHLRRTNTDFSIPKSVTADRRSGNRINRAQPHGERVVAMFLDDQGTMEIMFGFVRPHAMDKLFIKLHR